MKVNFNLSLINTYKNAFLGKTNEFNSNEFYYNKKACDNSGDIFCLTDIDKKPVEDNIFSYENLYETIGKIDLNGYKKGLPLKYPRDKFIKDFKKILEPLDNDDKNQVLNYFKFTINNDDDIIKFPTSNYSDISNYSDEAKKAILEARKVVDEFTVKNMIQIPENKQTEKVLNEFINIFPEFISVIGKIQHRGDSIDFHTLEDLQICLNDSRTKDLPKEEQEILFLAVMFHDIAKKQRVLHHGHQKISAYFARKILDRIPISSDEKERIVTLIRNSHWVTDYKRPMDLAGKLKTKDDFKMAQILGYADVTSSGFTYSNAVNDLRIKEVEDCIDIINKKSMSILGLLVMKS